MLLLLASSALLAVRCCEIAAERMTDSSLARVMGWMTLAAGSGAAMFVQWVAYLDLPAEVAEWIWVDVLGGGDRRQGRVLPEAKAFLLNCAIEVHVGTYTVWRRLSSLGVQIWLARMAELEANLHQEVLHR